MEQTPNLKFDAMNPFITTIHDLLTSNWPRNLSIRKVDLSKGRSGHRRTASAANIEAVKIVIEEANDERIPSGMRITCRRT